MLICTPSAEAYTCECLQLRVVDIGSSIGMCGRHNIHSHFGSFCAQPA